MKYLDTEITIYELRKLDPNTRFYIQNYEDFQSGNLDNDDLAIFKSIKKIKIHWDNIIDVKNITNISYRPSTINYYLISYKEN